MAMVPRMCLRRLLSESIDATNTRSSSSFKGAFYKPTKIEFPVIRTEGARPEVIYCHPLGCSWDMKLPLTLEQKIGGMGHAFSRFEYRFFRDTERVWDVRDWVADIVSLLDRSADASVVLFACSASAVAALSAALARPEKVHSLVLVSPGVGIYLDYMGRIVPGSLEKLEAGAAVRHPAVGDAEEGGKAARIGQLVTKEKLLLYGDIDPVRHLDEIPLECPVRIMHGLKDFLVPHQNSLLLADKLKSKDVEVMLLDNAYHIIDWIPEMQILLDRTLNPDSAPNSQMFNKSAVADYLAEFKIRETELKRLKALKKATSQAEPILAVADLKTI